MFLGVHYGHDANIAIIDDCGEILAYTLLERLDGIRHSGGGFTAEQVKNFFSENNIDASDIKYAGITSGQHLELIDPSDSAFRFNYECNGISDSIDQWAMTNGNSLWKESFLLDRLRVGGDIGVLRKYFPDYCKYQERQINESSDKRIDASETYSTLPYMINNYDICQQINPNWKTVYETGMILPGYLRINFLNKRIPAFFIDHHLAHIHSAYFKSPYDECIIFSADGGGSGGNGNLFCKATSSEIKPICSTEFAGGQLYTLAAKKIGLDPGKFMGLSAYGEPDKQFLEIMRNRLPHLKGVEVPNLTIQIYEEKHSVNLSTLDIRTLAPQDPTVWEKGFGSMCKIRADFAATIQRLYEYWLYDTLGKAILENDLQNIPLVLSGGCALNCPANQVLADMFSGNLYIETSCNDEGLGFGAAMVVGNLLGDISNTEEIRFKNRSPYKCRAVLNEDAFISKVLSSGYRVFGTIDWDQISNFLLQGKIGFICRGNAELGPRALGNRSIISLANKRQFHADINIIKGRELWRPLAPAVLSEDFEKYFNGYKNSYMLMTNQVTSKSIPAVRHSDNSARVQCVDPEQENFHNILTAIKNNSQECPPVIVNTSLNGPGQPIIDDLLTVLELFNKTKASFIVSDNFIVSKN